MGHYLVVVHSGAGFSRDGAVPETSDVCTDACVAAAKALKDGRSAMEAACVAVALLEDSPSTNAGKGSNLNREGEVECDASVMDGAKGCFGACGAVSAIKNPVYLAKAVFDYRLKNGQNALGLVPPMLLVGNGAWKFAVKEGIETVAPDFLITPARRRMFEKIKERAAAVDVASEILPSSDQRSDLGRVSSGLETEEKESLALDTVGAITVDVYGNVAVAASSGGIQFKHPGRVGQAAIYGAGVWCEVNDGETSACCTSGIGEQLIETDLARQLCKSLMQDGPFEMASAVKKKFLRAGPSNSTVPRYMGSLLLQVLDWQRTGRAFLQILHTTPAFCWAYASSKQERPKFERSMQKESRLQTTGNSNSQDVMVVGYSL